MNATKEDWSRLREAHPAIEPTGTDDVNHPAHYNHGDIECIDYLADNLGDGYPYYLEGNIKKYLHRWRYKNDSKAKQVEDLRKAAWYLGKLLETQVFKDSNT